MRSTTQGEKAALVKELREEKYRLNDLLYAIGLSRSTYYYELSKTDKEMLALVDDAERVLTDKNTDLDDFGRMLDHTWRLKRQTGSAVSTNMPRTKGSKNRVTASADFDAQIAKLQKDKEMLEEGLSKTVAHIEELKTDIKSLRESLKPQKAEIKQTEKGIAKLEDKKAAAETKAAEAAKKVEAEAVLKKLLASGMTADEILEKLK